MNYFNNPFFLTVSDKTTGSTYTVTGEKGGAVVSESGQEVALPDASSNESDVQSNTNSEVAVTNDETSVDEVPVQSGGFFGGGLMGILLVYGIFIAVFYYFVLRPQRKRQKEAQELVASLQVGDDILTSSGYYGKITDLGTDICVVEFGTNKGVRIPVRKSEIIKKESPQY